MATVNRAHILVESKKEHGNHKKAFTFAIGKPVHTSNHVSKPAHTSNHFSLPAHTSNHAFETISHWIGCHFIIQVKHFMCLMLIAA